MQATMQLDHPGDPTLLDLPGGSLLGDGGLNRLRWRCRRGLLENDLIIEKFFNAYGAKLTVGQALAMYELMRLTDNDLLDLLLDRTHKTVASLIDKTHANEDPSQESPQIGEVLTMLKASKKYI
jgi:antitoxin CptB